MIKLGTYIIRNSFQTSPVEIRKKLEEFSQREYRDGIKQCGWDGYIVAKQEGYNTRDEYTLWYYVNEPSVSWNTKFKITPVGLERM